MLSRVIVHVRHNVIAYLALGCSLLGDWPAALTPPSHFPPTAWVSKQIRNNSITPAKFNHSSIGGTILHWAQVDATGRIVSGSHGAREIAPLNNGGTYEVGGEGQHSDALHRHDERCCGRSRLPQPAGYVTAIKAPGPKHNGVLVNTLDVRAAPAELAFSVSVIC